MGTHLKWYSKYFGMNVANPMKPKRTKTVLSRLATQILLVKRRFETWKIDIFNFSHVQKIYK